MIIKKTFANILNVVVVWNHSLLSIWSSYFFLNFNIKIFSIWLYFRLSRKPSSINLFEWNDIFFIKNLDYNCYLKRNFTKSSYTSTKLYFFWDFIKYFPEIFACPDVFHIYTLYTEYQKSFVVTKYISHHYLQQFDSCRSYLVILNKIPSTSNEHLQSTTLCEYIGVQNKYSTLILIA